MDTSSSVLSSGKGRRFILDSEELPGNSFCAFGISWCRYRKLLPGHMYERQGTGGKTSGLREGDALLYHM